MDRSTLRTVLLVVGVFFLVWTLVGKGCNKDKVAGPPVVVAQEQILKLPDAPATAAQCVIETPEFSARVGAIGGGLQAFQLKGNKYVDAAGAIDLAHRTTIDLGGNPLYDYAPLRVQLRNDAATETQVPGDLVQFTPSQPDPSTCVLTHRTPDLVEIVRTMHATGRPYELAVTTTVKNLSKEPRKHAFSESLYALQFKKDEGGMLHRPGPNDVFSAVCTHDGGKLERKDKGSLRGWFVQRGTVDFVGISSSYLGQAIIPNDAGGRCALVAEDRGVKDTDSEQGLFHAVLAYDPRELAPEASATYSETAFLGPKERDILKTAAGGGHHLDRLIDLGMFSFIAQYLVMFVVFLHKLVDSWGFAIVLLTVTVRMALLPLTLPQIKSSISMRRLKPEIDAINKKFEGDAQAKMLATSQLYKKAGVNPLSGCLPALLQMPVWFALYTSLQTAIELYHEHFLFWRDLSAPDPRFVLPLVLGGVMFIQQKVTPMQMDPSQQKVMMYFMPAMFTVFMLFLPVGLGIYMLTNSVLGILQTVAVERYNKKTAPAAIVVKESAPGDDDDGAGRKAKSAKQLARRNKPSRADGPSGRPDES
ncbi:MAG: hypothetical protein NVSMB47_09880 [Polyangiales bacterium]